MCLLERRETTGDRGLGSSMKGNIMRRVEIINIADVDDKITLYCSRTTNSDRRKASNHFFSCDAGSREPLHLSTRHTL
jgi:hypothetical protein